MPRRRASCAVRFSAARRRLSGRRAGGRRARPFSAARRRARAVGPDTQSAGVLSQGLRRPRRASALQLPSRANRRVLANVETRLGAPWNHSFCSKCLPAAALRAPNLSVRRLRAAPADCCSPMEKYFVTCRHAAESSVYHLAPSLVLVVLLGIAITGAIDSRDLYRQQLARDR